MGNLLKFESKPEIRGTTPKITLEESNYFFRINKLLRNNYIDNMYSNTNLDNSLVIKPFRSKSFLPRNRGDITWLDYIKKYIREIIDESNYSWSIELLNFINKQTFLFESKYDSIFFYNEFLINTMPKPLTKDNDIDNNENIVNVDKTEYAFISQKSNHIDELDISENLGGEYFDLNTDLLDEAQVKYNDMRKVIHKYIKIFKEHIYKNNEHPIMIIISKFNILFCRYINSNLKTYENELKQNQISIEEYSNKLAQFEKEITDNLQNFITHMHCTVKLFYSTVIDYSIFISQEKEDMIDMLTAIFFKTGNLYESIYKLYNLTFSNEIQELQDKLIKLKHIKPKVLKIDPKFCLDEDTLELQKRILQKKNKEKIEKGGLNLEKNKSQPLNLIKEGEEEDKDDDFEEDIKIKEKNDLNNGSGFLFDKINLSQENKEENDNDSIQLFSKVSQLRNSLNLFNNKNLMFPKLFNKLRDTIAIKDEHINEAKKSGKLQLPYLRAIKLFTTVKRYKAPFEKLVILAAVFDQINDCVSSFWSEMKQYIKIDDLYIEQEVRIVIYLYIIIQSQMPEIIILIKMIENFTTPDTRSFNISTYLGVVEGSLEYIKNLKDLGINDGELLKDARKSLMEIVNQRLSLLG